MIVFNNYFKIVKKNLGMIIMYTAIFVFFAVLATGNSQNTMNFTAEKPKISIINNDTNSNLTKEFINYTSANAEIVELEDNEETIKDALFYRRVDYIMIIPKGFGNSIINSKPLKIETMKVPDSYGATYTEMLLNRFLNVASIYTKVGMSEDLIIKNISSDLKEETKVTILTTTMSKIENLKYFYNFANYTFLAICIYIIGLLGSAYNNKNIKRRNMVSKTSYKTINRSLMLGNLLLCLGIWLVYNLFVVIMYTDTFFTLNGLLYALNSLVFIILTLSIGMLIGTLVQSKEAQTGIVNVIALGTSFLCGAFVPQEFLGQSVLNIAHILPSYWYIKSNEIIGSLSKFGFNDIKPVIFNMGVLIIFTIAFLILVNVVTRMKRKES